MMTYLRLMYKRCRYTLDKEVGSGGMGVERGKRRIHGDISDRGE